MPNLKSIKIQHLSFKKGLTLIEILAVLAILGVLAAIILPAASYVTHKAKKIQAANNLRQIATSYIACMQEMGSSVFLKQKTINELAAFLANKGGLNDPSIWILQEDPFCPSDIPKSIISPSGQVHPKFKDLPLSFTVVVGVGVYMNPSTTPIAWTRGLREDGEWDLHKGVWGDTGGWVAFLDGHVAWYNNLKDEENQLCSHSTYEGTSSIIESLNPGVRVLE